MYACVLFCDYRVIHVTVCTQHENNEKWLTPGYVYVEIYSNGCEKGRVNTFNKSFEVYLNPIIKKNKKAINQQY